MPTFPGFHAGVDMSQYPDPIRAGIRKVAAQFYVTKSFRPIEIGNSRYYAIVARPSDEFSVYISTDREILILFSDYETFETRTLGCLSRVL